MIRKIQAAEGVWPTRSELCEAVDDASVAGPTRLQGNSGNDLD